MIFKYFQKLDIRNILSAKVLALSVQILTRGGSFPPHKSNVHKTA